MSTARQDRLYYLVPAFQRELDERRGQPLRALMAVLESEFSRLEEDVAALYDDWFIETCDLWVVPYIADLLGVRHLQDVQRIPCQRRLVANSIAYRRRKGTLPVLEHVIRDATGWCARSVEFAQMVAGTQHVARTRPDCGRTVDVRQFHAAAEIDGPTDTLAHTLDVDNSGQGKYNVDRIGLYVWRLCSYPIRRSVARPVEGHPGCFTFDPLGRDTALFHHPQPVTAITHPAQPDNLPLRLSRGDLAADLHAFRARYGEIEPDWRPANSRLYGPDRGLYIGRKGRPPIPPWAVLNMDLSQWPLAPFLDRAVVAVDVELGRFAFVDEAHLPAHLAHAVKEERITPVDIKDGLGDVIVHYNYGFSGDVGGGPYGRQIWLDEPAPETYHIYVAKESEVSTIRAAFDRWDEYRHTCARDKKKPVGRITILDNGLYRESDLHVHLPRGAQLTIAAGDGIRPIIQPIEKEPGVPRVGAERRVPEEEPVEPVIDRLLYLNGLYIWGGIQINTEKPDVIDVSLVPVDHDEVARPQDKPLEGTFDLMIQHCTVMPNGLGVQFKANEPAKLRLDIQHSIVGPLCLPEEVAALAVQDSIIDYAGGYAIAAPEAAGQPDLPPEKVPGPPVTLERTTVFGKVSVQELLSASEVIFTEPVFVEKRERGGIRFSHVPAGSQTPRREFCQPPDDAPASKVQPRFTSVHFGDPAYAQLGLDCPPELRRGGKDGTEMGVFCHLHRPQREINLEHILNEYIPSGMNAVISYVT